MNHPEPFKDLYTRLSDLRTKNIEKKYAERKDYVLGYLEKAFTDNSLGEIIIDETSWRESFEDFKDKICAAGFIVSKEEDTGEENTGNPGKCWYSISIK